MSGLAVLADTHVAKMISQSKKDLKSWFVLKKQKDLEFEIKCKQVGQFRSFKSHSSSGNNL